MTNVIAAFLINALLQIPLIALVAALAVRLLRNAPARQQHLVWVVALVLGLALPALSVVPRPAPPALAFHTVERAPGATVSSTFSLNALLESTQRPVTRGAPSSKLIAVGYGAFVLYRAMALLAAWRRTRRLVRTAGGDITALVRKRCTITGFRGTILSSQAVSTPMTVGAVSPIIVLPAALLEELSDDALISLVGHEAAHIRRRDFFVNLVLEILALPIAFHPVTWLLRRRVALTRELACDEQVTPALVAPRAYARALVEVASFACGAQGPLISLTMAGSDFEHRIRSIVRRRSMKTSRILLFIAWAALATAGAAATGIAVHPNSSTQDASRFEATLDIAPGQFGSGDAQARAAAACNAGRKRDVAAIPTLAAMLSDDAPIAQMRCYGGSWSPALNSFEHPSPGEQAALALASISQPAVDTLVLALDHGSPVVRRNAAWAIGEVRGSSSINRHVALTPMIRLLSDHDSTVRRAAAFGLSELKHESGVEPLIIALTDPDHAVRGMVAFALGEIRDSRATPALMHVVSTDGDAEVRRSAAWALGEIKDPRAVAVLTQALGDPRVWDEAKRALAEISD